MDRWSVREKAPEPGHSRIRNPADCKRDSVYVLLAVGVVVCIAWTSRRCTEGGLAGVAIYNVGGYICIMGCARPLGERSTHARARR